MQLPGMAAPSSGDPAHHNTAAENTTSPSPSPSGFEHNMVDDLVILTERFFMAQGQGQGEQSGSGSEAQQPQQQPQQQLQQEAVALAERILMLVSQQHLQESFEKSRLGPEETYREHKARACTICDLKSVRVVKDELGWKMVLEFVELAVFMELPEFRLVKDGERWKGVRVGPGSQDDSSVGHNKVTYIDLPLPQLYQRQPKFKFTLLGLILFLGSLWYIGESTMCSMYCKPQYCSPGEPCNWSPDNPVWGYSIPVKLDQWVIGGRGKTFANQATLDITDWIADMWDAGVDITKVDTSHYTWEQKRRHRRRLMKKGLVRPSRLRTLS